MSDDDAPLKKQKLEGGDAAPREGLLEQLKRQSAQKAAPTDERSVRMEGVKMQVKALKDMTTVQGVFDAPNFFIALGLKHGRLSDDWVRKKTKELLCALHPDRNGAARATEAFQKVQYMSSVLLDPAKKAKYLRETSNAYSWYHTVPGWGEEARARKAAEAAAAAAAAAAPVGTPWRQAPRTQPQTQTKPTPPPRRSKEDETTLVGFHVPAPHKLSPGDRIKLFTSAGPFGFDVKTDTDMGDPILVHVPVKPHMNREVRVSRVLVMRFGGVDLSLDRDTWTGYKGIHEDVMRPDMPFYWKQSAGKKQRSTPSYNYLYAPTAVDAAVKRARSLGD